MLIRELLRSLDYPLPGSSTPTLDKELMLAKVLSCTREFLYVNDDLSLTDKQLADWNKLYRRRLAGEPIAYLLGYQDFWNMRLQINHNVLIPRPESEGLVELVLREVKLSKAAIADLGTGSGAIALAIANEQPNWQIIATDISAEALDVARLNAQGLGGAAHNIYFYQGDWLRALPDEWQTVKLDAIVANPPYLAEDDPHLNSSIRFEPRSALVAARGGLEDIFTIIEQAKLYLKEGGLLALEHGFQQAEQIKDFWERAGGYGRVTTERDLAGLARISWALSG